MRTLSLSGSKLILMPFMLIAASSVYAADYYVTTSGSGNVCSKAAPCGSIQTAVDIANEGDTIKLAAGTYVENVSIGTPATPNSKPGLTIKGQGRNKTFVVSAGTNTQRPAGVAADIIFDVWSRDTVIEKLTVKHPAGDVVARDIGVFVGPPANNTALRKSGIVRQRTGTNLEPTQPGSRGILVFRAKGAEISRNKFVGNYQDHIHMPTSDSDISRNKVKGATRLGIVIIQESPASINTGNTISRNKVSGNGTDGIQIQGDNNIVVRNIVKNNGAVAIKLCGETDADDTQGDGDCVNPFDRWAHATGNIIIKNKHFGNAVDGIVDNGTNNTTY